MTRLYSKLIVTNCEYVKLNQKQALSLKCIGSIIDLHGAIRELLLDARGNKVTKPGKNDSTFANIFKGSIFDQLIKAKNGLKGKLVNVTKFEDRFNFCINLSDLLLQIMRYLEKGEIDTSLDGVNLMKIIKNIEDNCGALACEISTAGLTI